MYKGHTFFVRAGEVYPKLHWRRRLYTNQIEHSLSPLPHPSSPGGHASPLVIASGRGPGKERKRPKPVASTLSMCTRRRNRLGPLCLLSLALSSKAAFQQDSRTQTTFIATRPGNAQGYPAHRKFPLSRSPYGHYVTFYAAGPSA